MWFHKTDQQRDRSSQALHVVGEQIEQRVIAKSEGSESLLTEEACSAYKAEIEQIVSDQSGSHATSHLIDMLQNSLQVADRTRVKIKEQAELSSACCKFTVWIVNYDSTQQDYTRIRAEIEALQENIPNGTVSWNSANPARLRSAIRISLSK